VRVITSEAVTKDGLFRVHRVGERLYFEIPRSGAGREILVLQRTAAGGSDDGLLRRRPEPGGAFEREGNRLLLRQRRSASRRTRRTAITMR
jgi:hypothetical protein